MVLIVAGVGGYLAYEKYYVTSSSTTPTITVGMPLPLNSIIGVNMLQSAQMAVNQINAAGGVAVNGTHYKYAIDTYDTEEADPSIPVANGISGVTYLITQDHVNFLMGGYRSDVVLAELPLVASYKELYITFGADTGISSYVTNNYSSGGKYIFNGFLNTTNQNAQYGALPVFLLTAYHEYQLTGKGFPTNITNIAVLGEQAAWTQATIGGGGSSSPLWPILKAVGFNPVYINYFPLSPPGGSYGPLMTTLAGDGVQSIYMLAAGTETPGLIEDYSAANWATDSATGGHQPLLFGADVMSEFNGTTSADNYYKLTNGACAGEMTFGWGPTLPFDINPTSIPFYNQFEANYSVNPMFGDGFVYSAFYYLAAAIEKANSLNPNAIIPYLDATDYTGPAGIIQFSSSHGLVIPLAPYPTVPAFGMQWHNNGELYPLWSSLWTAPSFPAAATFTAGSSTYFENYQTPTGVNVGGFTVAL